MSPLSGFIIVIVAITIQISLYAINRIREPLKPDYSINSNPYNIMNSNNSFWKNAETTNGRLAMMGLFALVLNYGLFGWIIPGFF